MIKFLMLSALLLVAGLSSAATNSNSRALTTVTIVNPDSTRLVELDQFWTELMRTVREGDFEGYSALYHQDAVVAFGFGKKPGSMPVATALSSWKKGFVDTKAGKQSDRVEFRFSQRIGDATTAHETGMFIFSSSDPEGKEKFRYVCHFEMLLVKRNGKWLAVMEYQKSKGSEADWEALK